MTRLAQVAAWMMLGAGGLCAQEGPQGPQGLSPRPLNVKPPPVSKARVTGRVLCGDTRQPARGAVIMLTPFGETDAASARGGAAMGRVGINGEYAMEHVAAGTYAVIALLPGYLSPFDDLRTQLDPGGGTEEEAELRKRLGAGNLLHVEADGTFTRDLVLDRGASVSGRVQYADGAPALQAMIDLQKEEEDASTQDNGVDIGAILRTMMIHQSNGTDDRGSFRVSGIKPGKYRIAAMEPVQLGGNGADAGTASVMAMSDPRGLRYYSGDTLHRKDAKVYELRAGDDISGIEIRLPIDGFHTVRGTLTDKAGQAVGTAMLTLTDSSDASVSFFANIEADGSFKLSQVPPGSYTLKASSAMRVSPGHMTRFQDASVAVIVLDKDMDGLVLALVEDGTALKQAQPAPKED